MLSGGHTGRGKMCIRDRVYGAEQMSHLYPQLGLGCYAEDDETKLDMPFGWYSHSYSCEQSCWYSIRYAKSLISISNNARESYDLSDIFLVL